MLNIGDFARLGGVSIRTLHHYDSLGLLPPVEVDDASGWRRYELSQLAQLNRIVTLKSLGFTLDEVGEMLEAESDDPLVRARLERRRDAMLDQVRELHHRLAQVEARLRLIEGAHGMSKPQVSVKNVEAIQLAGLTSTVPADTDDFARAVEAQFTKVAEYMDTATASQIAPVGRYVPASPPNVGGTEVTTGYVAEDVPGLARIEMPPARVASVIHRGPMSTVGLSYQTVVGWAVEHGYDEQDVTTAPQRMVFLEADGIDQADWVVDVQLELP
ncbi:MAG: MerR family transcriptional regulator [Nocardioidaceae bacterium]